MKKVDNTSRRERGPNTKSGSTGNRQSGGLHQQAQDRRKHIEGVVDIELPLRYSYYFGYLLLLAMLLQ